MRNFLHTLLAAALLMAAGSCTKEAAEGQLQEALVTADDGTAIRESALQPDRMRIFVSEETAREIEADPTAYAQCHAAEGIVSIERTFPDAGEFEARSRRYGLHRWYDVCLAESLPLTKAGSSLKEISGIEKAEFIPRLCRPKYQDVGWRAATDASFGATPAAAGGFVFNDPYLNRQWHYINRGSSGRSGAKKGCDINVSRVWENYKPGSEDVIVAIVDGGIDYKHEDLADNMWRNSEMSGTQVYGYNFINDSYNISAESHGTHVAGIVAAVNNNGKGGCGVAGGDAQAGIPGVRLMSCQIFKEGSDDSGDDAQAIKWAADHGALICQNSWAYDEAQYMPSYAKRAVDYFNEVAGTDAEGNQTGPMKGGLVVFAVGNEETSEPTYPAAYKGVVSVSAIGSDYRLASYSNYGEWVTIAAPGGDDRDEIYSTIPNNRYTSFSGSSMAAPHVSGVAALIVANYGGEGFTRDNLLELLLRHTTDISGDNPARYPGLGLVNAYGSIASNTGEAPFEISGVTASADGRALKLVVSATPTTGDSSSWISGARIYYSETPFSGTDGIPFTSCIIRSECGETPFALECTELEYGKRYYIAAALTDEFGNLTPLSDISRIDIEANLAPVITPRQSQDNITVMAHENLVLEYDISDSYLDIVSISLDSDTPDLVSLEQEDGKVTVTIHGPGASPGGHYFTLGASDDSGMSSSLTVPYKVLDNRPPVLAKPFTDIIIQGGEAPVLDLGEHFSDPDGESLSYTVRLDNSSVLKTAVSEDKLSLIPQQYGQAVVEIVAGDAKGESVKASFRLLVRDQSKEVELYPNPVTDGTLHLRVGTPLEVTVTIHNAAGGAVLNQTLTVEPFDPAAIDLSALTAGVYSVTTTTKSSSVTRKIVKL